MSISDQNKAYWSNRVQKSKLFKTMSEYKHLTERTARGEMKESQLISGGTGIGKTMQIRQSCKVANRPLAVIPQSATILGLLEALEGAALKRQIALLDDPRIDMLEDPTFQLVLMAASQDEAVQSRSFDHASRGKRKRYNLAGLQFILLTNHNIQDTSKASRLMKPLLSRVFAMTIPDDRQETFEYTCYLAICEKLLFGTSLDVSNLVLDYMTENYHVLPDVSPRAAVKIAYRIKGLGSRWRETLDRQLLPVPVCRPWAGDVPKIVLNDGPRRPVKPKHPSETYVHLLGDEVKYAAGSTARPTIEDVRAFAYDRHAAGAGLSTSELMDFVFLGARRIDSGAN